MLNVTRIQDDPALVTAVFKLLPVINEAKSKAAGRPIFDEIEVCDCYLAANRYTQGTFPAHEVWQLQKQQTEYGEEMVPVTYAMRFNKQYLEFKSGGPQSISGTPIAELTFLSAGKRLELKALNIHTAESLAALDGANLKMLGPNGREMKNDAIAYLAKAAEGMSNAAVSDELSKRDAQIAELTRKLDALTPTGTAADVSHETISEQTVAGFSTFEDEDLRTWLKEAGVEVDGRWGRNKMLAKADEVLAKTGKLKTAA